MSRRPLYPHRDTMRVGVGIAAGRFIAVSIMVGAVVLAPDTIVSLLVTR